MHEIQQAPGVGSERFTVRITQDDFRGALDYIVGHIEGDEDKNSLVFPKTQPISY